MIKKFFTFTVIFALTLSLSAKMEKVFKSDFGKTKAGQKVEAFTLKNSNGMSVKIITFGARIIELNVPDKNGKVENVTLGFDNIADYEKENPYFGAVVGRVGNRIANAEFSLEGKTYRLEKNNGEHTLHGGFSGFDKKVWRVVKVENNYNSSTLTLALSSPDADGGFPAKLDAQISYTLTGNNELIFDYRAESDADTVCNLTQHLYFNLHGAGNGDILDHIIKINASKFTPVDKTLIPTGELRDVANTPFDFRQAYQIGSLINANDEQLKLGKGYDHNFCLDNPKREMFEAIELFDPQSGRLMRVFTDQIGVQFYSGNVLDGTLKSPNGKPFVYRGGLALETQHYPDSPNKKNFPSIKLKKGDIYKTRSIYQFDTRK